MAPVSGSLIMHLAIASSVGIVWALAAGPLFGIRRPEARSLLFGGALLAPVIALVVHLAVEHGSGGSHLGPYHFACLTGSWLGDAALLIAATAIFTVSAQAAVAWLTLRWLIREAVSAETVNSSVDSSVDSSLGLHCGPANSALALATLREVAAAAGVNSPPPLLLTARPGILCVAGVVRPAILMSYDVCDALDAEELAAVLAHEVAHVRRCDNAGGMAAALLRALVFFSPAAHVALRHYRSETENAADELAIRLTDNPLALASGIIKVWKMGAVSRAARAGGYLPGWATAAVGLSPLSGSGSGDHPGQGRSGGLPRRVRQLLGSLERPADRWRFGVLAAMALLIVLILVLC
jgi:Zn-dependent protease with chaperone function